MLDQLTALIVDESKWLTASMGLAMLAVVILRRRMSSLSTRGRVLAAMNLFFGVMIGTMAFGHLLAVTTKLVLGTLHGSLLVFYVIGIALAVPSWWLVLHTMRLAKEEEYGRKKLVVLNAWLGISLLAFGVHNFPLAAPAAWNIAYQFHSKRAVGWAIVSVAIIAMLTLFSGSIVFFLSGQSFEQFEAR